jgi:hypothetical protein
VSRLPESNKNEYWAISVRAKVLQKKVGLLNLDLHDSELNLKEQNEEMTSLFIWIIYIWHVQYDLHDEMR